MPQYWRIYMYQRNRDGISPEQLQRELGLPAEEIATRLEAARLCFEKQCVFTSLPACESIAARMSLQSL
jgi:hypothetical protein